MVRKILILILLLSLTTGYCRSQAFIKTTDLFNKNIPAGAGELNIYQNSALDSLISRYIISRNKLKTKEGTHGIEGFRIQIYYSSVRTAREESSKVRAEFISMFPDMTSYLHNEEPAWWMVRTGDYRTKAEGYKDLVAIRKEFPNAYLVPAIINFPDLIKK
jgi:hypothetical protein